MTFSDLKRRMYAGNRPGRLASFLNRFWEHIHALGVLPNYLITLEVEGRPYDSRVSRYQSGGTKKNPARAGFFKMR